MARTEYLPTSSCLIRETNFLDCDRYLIAEN